ncbi:SUMF1/EgtB/PvdO family nonheme iron enzyme [Prevotella sp. tf2-5]|uniref:SUMF1/EgtB/PvdO family nonheme iron enzyme n=1 Tax=Prevotella sp. tf2-5 TaxID=1761889 RepID=UPI0008E72B53|nr:SUMF1/EgtB/PvdO family nonheme iron enzyme [Prevotella sp. tf2-5]SFO67653.1 Formylglycine-generating enzyme, required for sulfatase activity, contains SUMF1/FGE domain [Prevotella sp. tf2-5]
MTKKIFSNKYFWWGLGLLVVLIATSVEVFRGRNTNYFDYQDSTRMFWEGLSPYNLEYAQAHQIYFLYSPVFSVLFAPIFYLPWWLGPYVWNIGNYTLFSLAIKWLPQQLDKYKLYIFVFLLSVVLQTVFCYQHNIIVAYIYLFAFILLERGKGFWAVFLIMLSATTKIYGAAELAILFCYPKTLRSFGYAILCGAFFLLLPAVNTNFDNVFVLYQQMFDMIASHHSDSDYIGILFAVGLKPFLLPNYRMAQVVVLAILAVLFFWRYKRWSDFRFRVQALGVLSGFMILFSDCPETHTYIICLPFYVMAFWLQPKRNWIDWTLFWSLVVNYMILPTDVLCPAWLHNFIHRTFWLDVYTYFFCWLRMIWWAVGPDRCLMDDVRCEKVELKVILPLLMLLLPLGTQAQSKSNLRILKVKGVTYKMRLVEGGRFMMGALPQDTLADADEVRHQETVGDYYIGETEVTQALWEVVMHKNRSKQKGADMPVEYVTYEQIQEFIVRLNKMSGRHFRLPTEAEWEYAARGGRQSKGYLYAGSNNPDEVAYTLTHDFDDHHKRVAQLKPNELGLYDMSGNVWEFCEDWYRKTPTGKPSGNFHVMRGGSYDCDARYSRVTNRFMYDVRRRRMEVGFRLVMEVR